MSQETIKLDFTFDFSIGIGNSVYKRLLEDAPVDGLVQNEFNEYSIPTYPHPIFDWLLEREDELALIVWRHNGQRFVISSKNDAWFSKAGYLLHECSTMYDFTYALQRQVAAFKATVEAELNSVRFKQGKAK